MIIALSNLYAFSAYDAGKNLSELNDNTETKVNSIQATVTGTVKDAAGLPLPNVNIIVVGTNTGTQTDFDGNFSIQAQEGDVLEFSFIGMKTLQVTIQDGVAINVAMEDDANALDEVVVTALGVERSKKALAYSVGEVDGSDLVLSRDPNVGNALAGKVAGVNVTKTATGPGGSTRVIIRGTNALGGNNQPLYVVDGVPIDNSNHGSAGQWGGYDGGDGISNINPDDIESMTVLKGAAAGALYGYRAANGVILVTTKTGSRDKKVVVEFNSNLTMEQAVSFTDWQTQYGIGNKGAKPTTQDEASQYGNNSWGDELDGSSVIQFDGESRPYSYQGNAMDAFYDTGHTFTNTLTMSGGSENATYRFSASDLNNESVMPNSGLKRQNFSTNMSYKLGDFSAQISGAYVIQQIKNAPSLSDGIFNANSITRVFPTSLDINNLRGDPEKLGADPETGGEYLGTSSVWWTNPYWVTHQAKKNHQKNRIYGNMLLKYDIAEWLYVQARAGTDYYVLDRDYLEPYGHGYKPEGGMTSSTSQETENNIDFIVGGQKDFDFGLGLNIIAGGNRMNRISESKSVNGQSFAIPYWHSYNNAKSQSSGIGFAEVQVNSLYYQAEFSYNSIYLTTTGRNDWFSTLDGRSIFYPSIGASAVLSDMFDTGLFDYLQVKGSWGQVGGSTGPYQTSFSYGLGTPHFGIAQGGIANGSIPNQFLVPSLTTEVEVGFDTRLLNGRLGFEFAYYDRISENNILNADVTISSGYGATTVNVAELSNKGIEFKATGVPIRNDNFRWTTTLNYSYNDSEVVSLLDPEVDDEFTQGGGSRTLTAYIRNIEGMPYGQIVGFRYARDGSGNVILDDNGLPTREDEMTPFGSGVAPHIGGWINNFQWKNWSLNILFDFKFGGYLHSGTNSVAYQRGNHKATLEGRETGIGTVAAEDVQNYYGRIGGQITEDFIYKSDFVKFRELALSYNFASEWLDKTPMTDLALSLVGRNLFILYKDSDNVDPESTYNSGNDQGLEYMAMPSVRSIGLNLNIKF